MLRSSMAEAQPVLTSPCSRIHGYMNSCASYYIMTLIWDRVYSCFSPGGICGEIFRFMAVYTAKKLTSRGKKLRIAKLKGVRDNQTLLTPRTHRQSASPMVLLPRRNLTQSVWESFDVIKTRLCTPLTVLFPLYCTIVQPRKKKNPPQVACNFTFQTEMAIERQKVQHCSCKF